MGLFSKHNLIFLSPLDGEAAPLSKIPDHAFSQGLLGAGLVIFPTKNKVYAPTDGKIDFIFPTKHAIGFETKEGFEYLIHVGIDTYKLKGDGFQLHVEAGDRFNPFIDFRFCRTNKFRSHCHLRILCQIRFRTSAWCCNRCFS